MAARLEAATKQFETPLLISGHLRDILSYPLQSICREIDTVTVKGSIKPMRLYTISIQVDDMEVTVDPMLSMSIKEKKKLRDRIRKDMFSRLFGGRITTWQEFTSDSDFMELRKSVDLEFEANFSDAYKLYIKGDWQAAGKKFSDLVLQNP